MTYQKRTQRKLQCKHCDNEFIASRFDAKFCSRSCAVLFKREEKRLNTQESVSLDQEIQEVKPKRRKKKIDENIVVYKTIEFDIRLMDLHQCKKLYEEIRHEYYDVSLVNFIPFLLKRIENLEAQREVERIRDKILLPTPKKTRQRRNRGLKSNSVGASVRASVKSKRTSKSQKKKT